MAASDDPLDRWALLKEHHEAAARRAWNMTCTFRGRDVVSVLLW